MQPGNNYRAAASCVDDVFAASAPDTPQADQTDADDKYDNHTSTWSDYEVPAVWSRMLTVWRKLWVERDTMGAPDPVDLAVVASVSELFPTPDRALPYPASKARLDTGCMS